MLLLSESFSAQKCKVASKIARWHYNFAKVVKLGLYSSRNGSIHKILFHLLAKNSLLIVSDCCEKMSNQALKDFRISFKITQVFLQEKDQKFVGHSLMNLIFCDILFNLVAKYWISIHLSFSQSRLCSKHEVTITMLT